MSEDIPDELLDDELLDDELPSDRCFFCLEAAVREPRRRELLLEIHVRRHLILRQSACTVCAALTLATYAGAPGLHVRTRRLS